MMATADNSGVVVRVKKNVTIYDCPICLEEFKTPKYLPCLHTFCEICLQTYIKSTAIVNKETRNSTFVCPVCRMKVTGPTANVGRWATKLPFNHIIFSLMTDERLRNKDTYNCDPCARVGDDMNATGWCQICNELLCDDCQGNFHKRLKNSDQHNILSLSVGHEIPQITESKIDEPCIEHLGKTIEVYCSDHFQMCCVICWAKIHRECQNIKTLDEIVEEFMTGDLEKDSIKGLKFISKEMTNLVSRKKNEIARLKKEEEMLILKYMKQIDYTIAKLQEVKLQLKKDVAKAFTSEIKPIEIQTETLIGFNQNIQQNIKFLTTVKKYGSTRQIFLTLQKLHDRWHVQRNQFDNAVEDETVTAVIAVDLQPSLMSLIRNTEPVFKITKSYSKSRWKDTSKVEISKKMEELNERFVRKVKGEDVNRDIGTEEIHNQECAWKSFEKSEAADYDSSEEDNFHRMDSVKDLPGDEDRDLSSSEDGIYEVSDYSGHQTLVHLKSKTKISQKERKRGKKEKRRFHNKI